MGFTGAYASVTTDHVPASESWHMDTAIASIMALITAGVTAAQPISIFHTYLIHFTP